MLDLNINCSNFNKFYCFKESFTIPIDLTELVNNLQEANEKSSINIKMDYDNRKYLCVTITNYYKDCFKNKTIKIKLLEDMYDDNNIDYDKLKEEEMCFVTNFYSYEYSDLCNKMELCEYIQLSKINVTGDKFCKFIGIDKNNWVISHTVHNSIKCNKIKILIEFKVLTCFNKILSLNPKIILSISGITFVEYKVDSYFTLTYARVSYQEYNYYYGFKEENDYDY